MHIIIIQCDVISEATSKTRNNNRQPIECDGIEKIQSFIMYLLIILVIKFLHANF